MMNDRSSPNRPEGSLPTGLWPSRLPGDAAYWDGLTKRVIADSRTELRRYGRQAGPWWFTIGDFSPALAAAAVLAILAGWLLFPEPAPPVDNAPIAIVEGALSPQDPIARRLLSEYDAPPSIGSLLGPSTGEDR